MTRSYAPLLVALGALWGASYLFIKVAVDEIEPTTMMAARTAIAAAALVAFLFARHGVRAGARDLRAAWRPGLVLGIVNAAVPFTLIAWGEKHVDSGVAAVANASVPLFVALLAVRFRPSERSSGLRLVGVVTGVAGVAVLAGGQPDAGLWQILGTTAVVLASFAYAVGGLYGQLHVGDVDGPVLAAAAMIAAAVVLLPAGIVQAPGALPSWSAIGSVLALSLLGTALGMVLMFRLLRLHGAARTSLVTYLMPATAIVYGSVFLDERITAGVLGGLVLILVGVALGSGGVRVPRRSSREAAPQL